MKFEHGIYEKETIIDFGTSQKGKTIEYAINNAPQYIVWVSQNHPDFKLDLQARCLLKEVYFAKYGYQLQDGN